MSAVVCGSKRSFFDEIPSPPSPPITKKLRRFSPSSSSSSLLDRLFSLFPHMEPQILERALEESGDDLDAAIERLHELCLSSGIENRRATEEFSTNVPQGVLSSDGNNCDASKCRQAPNNLPVDGAEWVELFVKEMVGATSLEDARARVMQALEVLEQSIKAKVGTEIVDSSQKENMMLKEQMDVLIRENSILKRAVAIQHERQKEYEDKNHELEHLKQLVAQYQEQLRILEVNNYALTLHLRQAQQGNSFPGRSPPDIF